MGPRNEGPAVQSTEDASIRMQSDRY